MPLTDPKGNLVEVDSYVEGFHGRLKQTGRGRVFFVFPHGHVAVWTDDPGKLGTQQVVMYAGRYLVRGAPRPIARRTDVPERLKRQ